MIAPRGHRDDLLFVPLGGSGEIGMNLNLYHYAGRWLMVDLGVTFPESDALGIDVVMPDPAFIVERRDQLLGLVLTHAHEDHLGAVPYLWPQLECPIYATPFTAAILRAKLASTPFAHRVRITEVPLGGNVKLGPFDITFLSITHSIPESNALAIRTPAGNILHTGDWKLDPDPMLGETTNRDAFAAFGREGVMAMVCDSTNVFENGRSGSEGEVYESLRTLIDGRRGRVAVTTFASHLARVKTIARIGRELGRDVALIGRSLWRTVGAARDTGYLDGFDRFVGEDEIGFLPPDKALLICTGCQGEPRAAMARIATNNHPSVVLEEGDTAIFSSKVIPGNERSIAAVQNRLIETGVEVIGEKDHFVHVSGHPAREELADMYRWIRPRTSIPVHGEARHLAEHARYAQSLQVGDALAPRNGTLIKLNGPRAEVVDYVPVGRLVSDGVRILAADSEVFRERRRLAVAGLVVVSVILARDGALAAAPRVALSGIMEPGDRATITEDDLGLDLGEDIGRLPAGIRGSDDRLDEAVRRLVRQRLKDHTAGRPVIRVEVIRLDGGRRARAVAEPVGVSHDRTPQSRRNRRS